MEEMEALRSSGRFTSGGQWIYIAFKAMINRFFYVYIITIVPDLGGRNGALAPGAITVGRKM